MSALRQLRNLWMPSVTTVVLACCSNAVAQVSYKVTDLGVLHNWNQGCAMALNEKGWTEDMDGILDPSGQLATGRAVIHIDGTRTDLGTLGGANSWMNWGGNSTRPGQRWALPKQPFPILNGEDICVFGTHPYVPPVYLARGPHESSPDARRK